MTHSIIGFEIMKELGGMMVVSLTEFLYIIDLTSFTFDGLFKLNR